MDETDYEIVLNEVLSKDEVFKLQESVRCNGEINEAEVERLLRWAIKARTDVGCLDLLMEGFIGILGWKENEPQFGIGRVPDDFFTELDEGSHSGGTDEETAL
jgi:hypothetical protein